MTLRRNNQLSINDKSTEFLFYTTPNGEVKVEVILNNENLWLTQEKMAELFGVQRPAITKHLKNIFLEGELDEKMVSSILEHTTMHGAIEDKGKISHEKAKQKAFTEYDEFNKTQLIESDFDREIKKLLKSEKEI